LPLLVAFLLITASKIAESATYLCGRHNLRTDAAQIRKSLKLRPVYLSGLYGLFRGQLGAARTVRITVNRVSASITPTQVIGVYATRPAAPMRGLGALRGLAMLQCAGQAMNRVLDVVYGHERVLIDPQRPRPINAFIVVGRESRSDIAPSLFGCVAPAASS
jgi:hypothetical protein